MNPTPFLRQTVLDLEESRIREVANAGMGRSDVLAFWFGESDEVTPEAVRQAAAESLARGETFYSHNLGLAELREALRAYLAGLHGDPGPERIAVTSSGVNALMLAMQMLVDAGDEVAAVVPLWPNLTAQAQILGGRVRRIALQPRQGRWTLDVDALCAAVTPATRALLLNAPGNPTGWTLTRTTAEWSAALDHAAVPCSPILAVGQVLAHPHVAACGMTLASNGHPPMVANPMLFDGIRPTAPLPPPTLGSGSGQWQPD